MLNLWVINEEQVYNPAPFKIAEMIKWDLAQAGVKVKVRAVTRPFLTAQLRNQSENYDLILSGWLAGNLDPDGFMRPILSCGTKMNSLIYLIGVMKNLINLWIVPLLPHI